MNAGTNRELIGLTSRNKAGTKNAMGTNRIASCFHNISTGLQQSCGQQLRKTETMTTFAILALFALAFAGATMTVADCLVRGRNAYRSLKMRKQFDTAIAPRVTMLKQRVPSVSVASVATKRTYHAPLRVAA
jgi:hypothetical protein